VLLHSDRLDLKKSNINKSINLDQGLNYTITWRKPLPQIIKAGLGLFNFATTTNTILSYKTTLYALDEDSGIVNIKFMVSYQNVFGKFSIIVITEDNNYIELLSM